MKKSIASFVVVVLIIGLFCYTAINGLNLGFTQIPSVLDEENGIRRGLDLVGGSSITFEADLEEGDIPADIDDQMDAAQAMLQSRLTTMGYTEAQVSRVGETRLLVEIPAIDNPEEAVQQLGSTAQLQFLDADGNEVMNGSDVEKATAQYGDPMGAGYNSYFVELQFKSEAREKFYEATKNAAEAESGKNYISIVMDGEVKSAPGVTEAIDADSCVITGGFDETSAKELADFINIGQLPFNLKQVELRSVGPQLGENALSRSLLAGLIGLCLIAVFMIAVYRLPGLVATIALLFYVSLVCVILAVAHVNLSLPGIAGIILGIGMAVDANVVIFERIKEELRAGKTVRSAIDSGFHRAFTAIIDSNVTTLIAAVVLYFFGTGTIVGFALTLGIGVLVSMFTAITVTKFLLRQVVNMKITNVKAYGA